MARPLRLTYEGVMDNRQKRQASVYRRFVEAGIIDMDAAFMDAKHRSRFCLVGRRGQVLILPMRIK